MAGDRRRGRRVLQPLTPLSFKCAHDHRLAAAAQRKIDAAERGNCGERAKDDAPLVVRVAGREHDNNWQHDEQSGAHDRLNAYARAFCACISGSFRHLRMRVEKAAILRGHDTHAFINARRIEAVRCDGRRVECNAQRGAALAVGNSHGE